MKFGKSSVRFLASLMTKLRCALQWYHTESLYPTCGCPQLWFRETVVFGLLLFSSGAIILGAAVSHLGLPDTRT